MNKKQEIIREWGPLTDELFQPHPFTGFEDTLGEPIPSDHQNLGAGWINYALDGARDFAYKPNKENHASIVNHLTHMIANLIDLKNRMEACDPRALLPYEET